jgi:hypothetical protein
MEAEMNDNSDQPWLDFTDHLLPIQSERHEVLRWCATLIAEPEVRMHYGLLLMSKEQGTGKSTLARINAELVGRHNVSYPNESQLVRGGFNGWIAHKRLIIINEIYQGHSWRAYRVLLEFLAEDRVQVNEKYVKPYTIENWAHVIATSNSKHALNILNTDRRWLIPKVTEDRRTPEYWMEFNRWLEDDGLSIIYRWAIHFVKKYGVVRKAGRAPMTETKEDLIQDSYSVGEQLVLELAAAASTGETWKHEYKGGKSEWVIDRQEQKIMLSDIDVRAWLAVRLDKKIDDPTLTKASAIRDLLEQGGLVKIGFVKAHGGRRMHLLSPKEGPGAMTSEEWKEKSERGSYSVDPSKVLPDRDRGAM